jgi:hypothetical protein
MLCTTGQIKTFCGIDSAVTDFDAVLAQLVDQVADLLTGYAGLVDSYGVPCLEKADVVQTYMPGPHAKILYAPAAPVLVTTSVIEAWDGLFTGSNAITLVADRDYHLTWPNGLFTRIGMLWLWREGIPTVQFTGRVGYTVADAWSAIATYALNAQVTDLGRIYTCKSAIAVASATRPSADTTHWTLETYERPMPPAVNLAAVMQTAHLFNRRKKLGLASEGASSSSSSWSTEDDLLPMVKATMDSFRRISF